MSVTLPSYAEEQRHRVPVPGAGGRSGQRAAGHATKRAARVDTDQRVTELSGDKRAVGRAFQTFGREAGTGCGRYVRTWAFLLSAKTLPGTCSRETWQSGSEQGRLSPNQALCCWMNAEVRLLLGCDVGSGWP